MKRKKTVSYRKHQERKRKISGMGFAFINLNENNEAIIAYDKALEINPNLVNIRHNKNNVLRILGR